MIARGLLLLLAAFLLAGCQHRLTPPANVADPARVYVIDYGRHASLALPAPDRGLAEWSWGDWHFFALGRTGLGSGLRALFASPQSTLSRRSLAPATSAEELQRRLGAAQVLAFDVERARAEALLARLERRWSANRGQALSHADGRVFVPDPARYSLGNNSVHELVRWLEQLGVEVRGSGVTANFRIDRPPTR